MSAKIEITRQRYPENIRNNVSMYLGEAVTFTHPLQEVINNSEDELLNGYANMIHIINREGYKLVVDNGRGIPIYPDPENPSESILKSTVTDLHAGSKLGDNLEITSGTHGVGSSAVNAVSERFVVIRKLMAGDTAPFKVVPGEYYIMGFRRGILEIEMVCPDLADFENTGIPEEVIVLLENTDFSTAVYLVPDMDIYQSGYSKIDTNPLMISLVGRDATITINGETLDTWNFRRDVADGSDLFLDKSIKYDFKFNNRLSFSGEIGYSDKTMSYTHVDLVNLITNTNGGIHEKMVAKALGQMLNKVNSSINVADARLGLILFTNVFSSYRTQFSSQTKERLVGFGMKWSEWMTYAKTTLNLDEVEASDYDNYSNFFFSDKEFVSQLTSYFTIMYNDHSEFFDALIAKILAYRASLNKLSNMDFIKSKLVMGDELRKASMSGNMAKIYEASSTKWADREIYITEGPSASGNIIKVRDDKLQSVLPLRGKMRNSASLDIVEFVDNPELLTIINTIGCGMGGMIDLEKSRYGKIIISTDLDVDGQHISNLISSIFLIHAPEIIKAGMLYKMISPFYVVKTGKKTEYFYADEKHKIDFDKSYVERRKGLGSYTEDETRQFITNPKSRRLVQIQWEDDADVLEEARSLLYSSLSRRKLLESVGLFA